MSTENRETLLIVEDDELLRPLLVENFAAEGYRVFSAENGRIGYDIFAKEKIDLIITDLRMPGGDGMELLRRVRANDPVLPPVILLTGYAGATAQETDFRGAAAVIDKPFNRRALFERVRSILDELPKKTG